MVHLDEGPVDEINLRFLLGKKSRERLLRQCLYVPKKMKFFVTNIRNDYILGEDFLSEIGLLDLFEIALGLTGSSIEERGLVCSRLENRPTQLPDFLSRVIEQGSSHLNPVQRKDFFNFLFEFQDIFSENVIAGKCDMLDHKINLLDSYP